MVTPRPPRPGANDAELIAWAEANPWAIVEAAARRGWTLSTRSVMDGARPTGRLIVEVTTPAKPEKRTARIQFGPDNPAPEWPREFLAAIKAFGAPDGRSVLARLAEVARPVAPERRRDPILPAPLAMVHRDDSRAGRLYAPAVRANPDPGPPTLPGFGPLRPVEVRTPAFPLALYALGLGGGKVPSGAPLALRLFVEAVLSVPLAARSRSGPVLLHPVRLRDLVRWLYPEAKDWRAAKDWPRLAAAFEALESPQARIPWEDPETGDGGLRRVVMVRDCPRAGRLDDWVSLAVDLPPGSGSGPQVDRERLRYWGAHSAPAYRALLGLAYAWHNPGRTHFPVRGGAHWLRTVRDLGRYPPEAAALGLAFPVDDVEGAALRKRRQRAREVMRALAVAGDCRIERGRILPPSDS